MQQEFQWCNNKSLSTKPCVKSGIIIVTIPYCTIYYYYLRNSLQYMPIHKVLLGFLQYLLFLSVTVFTVTILFIVSAFVIVLDIQILYAIISAITPVSAIAQLYLFFFTVSIIYQNLLIFSHQYSYQVGFFYQLPISGTSISVVIISATPLSYFYQYTVSAIKQSYHLFT